MVNIDTNLDRFTIRRWINIACSLYGWQPSLLYGAKKNLICQDTTKEDDKTAVMEGEVEKKWEVRRNVVYKPKLLVVSLKTYLHLRIIIFFNFVKVQKEIFNVQLFGFRLLNNREWKHNFKNLFALNELKKFIWRGLNFRNINRCFARG